MFIFNRNHSQTLVGGVMQTRGLEKLVFFYIYLFIYLFIFDSSNLNGDLDKIATDFPVKIKFI